MFFLDIVVSFRTTYYDENTGREVKIPRKMAKTYLKNAFTIDVMSTLPFDLIASLATTDDDGFKVLGVLKLIRVLRLNKLITFMRSNEQVKATLKLFKLVFFLVLYLHCFGCIWWLITSKDASWVPPWNFNDIDFYEIYEREVVYQYAASLYAAVLICTGNDISPRSTFQVYFCNIGLFMGAIINANIFGELAVLVAQMSQKT